MEANNKTLALALLEALPMFIHDIEDVRRVRYIAGLMGNRALKIKACSIELEAKKILDGLKRDLANLRMDLEDTANA